MSSEECNCKPCEEGAPEWVVTFGDLMSLLLCFFVLLLSFSEMDRKKYKVVSGSMKNAFGVQKKDPVFESPKGNKIIAKEFDQPIIASQIEEIIAKPIIVEVRKNFSEWEDLIQVEVEEDKVTIRMLGETTFDIGRAEIRYKMRPLLIKIGSLIRKVPGNVIIAGHTDNAPLKGGRYRSNLGLSLARSASVAEFLMQRSALPPDRVSTMGFGESQPLATNKTLRGRQKNRRVEIIVTQ